MSSKRSSDKESKTLLKNFIALLLILGCFWASQWQFQRGIDRQDRNQGIESQLTLAPVLLEDIREDLVDFEWRTVTTRGSFDPTNQILLKNRYFEGVYGYEVLTRFTATDGRTFWVDRGWVKAGKDATTAPVVSPTPTGEVSLNARLRLDRSLPQGAFFALPASGSGMISKLNAQTDSISEGFYLDLLSGSQASLTPEVPAQVPELSDGPHIAYSLQWIFFAGLIVYGRILIRRGQILTSKELRVEPPTQN
jgi:cytochrome oxidase assembly protein ShyY1